MRVIARIVLKIQIKYWRRFSHPFCVEKLWEDWQIMNIRSGGTCKTEIFNLGTKYMYLYIALFWASTKYMYFVVFQKNPAQSTSTSNLTWNRIFRYKSTSFLDIFWSKSCILNSRFWHRVLHTVFSSKVYVLSKFGTIFRE